MNNNQLNTVRIGDSFQFSFVPFDTKYAPDGTRENINDWTCTIYVRSEPDGSDLITPRSVAVNNTTHAFSGYLTDTETTFLTAGTKFLIAEMDNGTRHKEKMIKFSVLEKWQ